MAASRNCCCSRITCEGVSPGPFIPPWGCSSCLCSTATMIYICVTEVGDLTFLSTTKPYKATGTAGSYTFANTIDGHTVTITVDYEPVAPEGFEETTLRVFVDAEMVREFTIATNGNYCGGSGSEDGASYVWQAKSWSNLSSFELTLAGINLVISPSCDQNPCFSAAIDDPNGVYTGDNYSDYPSGSDIGCGFDITDSDIQASVCGLSSRLRVQVTTEALGLPLVRGFYIHVYSSAIVGGHTSYYFLGVVDLDDDENCQGQWTISNVIDEACVDTAGAFGLGNYFSIGWGGTATLKVMA